MSSDGEDLAKVMLHFGIVPYIGSSKIKVMCPFHLDKNPSMTANFENGLWYCFGCGAKGDAKQFVKLMEAKAGRNDLQALRTFNNIIKGSSVNVNPLAIQEVSSEATRRHLRHLYDEAYDFYHGLAKVDWKASERLEEVSEALDYMESRGFTADVLNEVGAKVTYQSMYSLVFPMRDNGVFKGWVSRTMDPEMATYRKYLYNKGFSRATTLVGDYGVFGNKLDDYVIVVEGFIDRLKLLQFGIKNVVAILGWKMSDQQIEKLKAKGITVVISALDNDECGRKGTEYLKKHFKVVRWSYLKGIKDPGDMTKGTCDKMYKRTMKRFSSIVEKE